MLRINNSKQNESTENITNHSIISNISNLSGVFDSNVPPGHINLSGFGEDSIDPILESSLDDHSKKYTKG